MRKIEASEDWSLGLMHSTQNPMERRGSVLGLDPLAVAYLAFIDAD